MKNKQKKNSDEKCICNCDQLCHPSSSYKVYYRQYSYIQQFYRSQSHLKSELNKESEKINKIALKLQVLTDAAIAETVPRVAVSSKSNKADETGFASRNGFRDGGGYEELEVYGDSDKDKYGYATEVGFGKRTSSRDGKDPKVQDKHTYRKVSKLGNGFAPKSEQLKDIDIMDDATTLRKTVEEKPRR